MAMASQLQSQFSSKSHGCIASKIGRSSVEIEVGGRRKLSKFSIIRWLYSIGIQILLTGHLNPVFATGALFVPASLYFLLKKFVIKPHYLRMNKQKALEKEEKTSAQVQEARAAAEKAQQLKQNVANRKRNGQIETDGLVITRALYGNHTIWTQLNASSETNYESTPEVMDVTRPLNFHVSDSGQLKVWVGDHEELLIPQVAHRI